MNKENIINDLLPLYVEDMLSEDSKAFVDENIGEYQSSIEMLRDLKTGKDKKIDDFKPLNIMREALKKDKRSYGLSLIMLVTSIIIIGGSILFRPIHLNSGEITYNMEETKDRVFIEFDDNISKFRLDNKDGTVYVEAYTNLFDRLLSIKHKQVLAIDKKVVDVLIYENHDEEAKILYGDFKGGIAILPRLALALYFKLLLVTISGLLITFFVLKRLGFDKLKNIVLNIIYLNFSFISAFFTLRGFQASSFYFAFDLMMIGLLSISYFILIISVKRLLKKA